MSWLILSMGLFYACAGRPSNDFHERADREVASIEGLMSEPVRLVFNRSCQSCHGHDGHGIAGIAPDLRGIKPRNSEEWQTYLRTSTNSHPVSQVPPVWLDQEEIKLIAGYLTNSSRENKQEDQ